MPLLNGWLRSSAGRKRMMDSARFVTAVPAFVLTDIGAPARARALLRKDSRRGYRL